MRLISGKNATDDLLGQADRNEAAAYADGSAHSTGILPSQELNVFLLLLRLERRPFNDFGDI